MYIQDYTKSEKRPVGSQKSISIYSLIMTRNTVQRVLDRHDGPDDENSTMIANVFGHSVHCAAMDVQAIQRCTEAPRDCEQCMSPGDSMEMHSDGCIVRGSDDFT